MLASPWHHSGFTAGDFFVSVMFGIPAWVHFCLFIQLLYIVFIAHNELNKVLITPCGIALPLKKQGCIFNHRGASKCCWGRNEVLQE